MASENDHVEVPTLGGTLNYLALLVSLLFVLTVVPLFEEHVFESLLMKLGVTGVLVFGIITSSNKRGVLIPALTFMAIALALNWTALFIDHPTLFVTSCVVQGLFFGMTAVLILVGVIRRHLASVQSVFGAISAFLLLGLAWSMLYWALERIDDESLNIAHRTTINHTVSGGSDITAFSQMIYFSFVTMSTLGYGDITPETPLARTLTWTQSVTGQFYLAVMVAWLINAIPRQPRTTKTQAA